MPTPPNELEGRSAVPTPPPEERPGPGEIARDEAQTERQAPPNASPGEPAAD